MTAIAHLADAYEQGSKTIAVRFNQGTLTPNSVVWSLVDTYDGSIVNSRERVNESPASIVYIALDGDDLAILHGGEKEERELVIEITYDSIYGNNRPQTGAIRFKVINLKYLPGL